MRIEDCQLEAPRKQLTLFFDPTFFDPTPTFFDPTFFDPMLFDPIRVAFSPPYRVPGGGLVWVILDELRFC
jgi:hypothetical protein